jgi:putative ABC transport system permease protein
MNARAVLRKIVNLCIPRSAEREMNREMESHLALLAENFEKHGMTPKEAREAARRSFGNAEHSREMHREARAVTVLERVFKDVRFGIRGLRRNPVFTIVSILTLSIGLGSDTALFSVVNSVLLRPLDYRDADQLVTVLHDGTGPVAPANYFDWRNATRSFETMAAAEAWEPNLTGVDSPEHLVGLRMTANMLPMLGVRPMAGRWFNATEERKGADHEVILSYRLWNRRFNGNPNALDKQILLNGEAFTIVGVMPERFRFAPFWQTRAEIWAPLSLEERAANRGGNSLRVFARLRSGVTLEHARKDIAGIAARLEREFPGSNRGVVVTPLKENVTGKVKAPLLILLGAGALVLLIACANVSHLLLARTLDRRREIAVRAALGAGRSRVFSQFLVESLLIGMAGAAGGLLLAVGGLRALVADAPTFLPRVENVAIDSRVILFLLALVLVFSLIFGLTPAIRSTKEDVSESLKEGGRSATGGAASNRLRNVLAACEFALAFVLLAGAGVMIRSLIALDSLDAGFHARNVLSMTVSVTGSPEAAPGGRAIFYSELLDRIRAIPGVESASGINHLPLAGDMWGMSFRIAGRPEPKPGESPRGIYRIVMPGYFETMRLPLIAGRAINRNDAATAPGVVVINQRAARRYWLGQDPIGQRISLGDPSETYTIIGVSADAKQSDWASEPMPEIYLAALQNTDFMENQAAHFSYITLVARTRGNPADFAAGVKDAVWSFDRNLPISQVLTMDRVIADATAQPRFEMYLLEVMAGVALLLAAVGIYGVMSYSVSQRTHEIGIRVSLGASRKTVLRMIGLKGIALAAWGAAAGLVGAAAISSLMAKIVYGIRPTDPVTLGLAVIALFLTAAAATLIPARKALSIEPMRALRHE